MYAAQGAYFPSLPLSYSFGDNDESLATIPEDASVCSSAPSSDASDCSGEDADSASEASAALQPPLCLPVLGLEVPSPETWELVHVRLHSTDGYCWQAQLLGVSAASPAAAWRALARLSADELLKVVRRVHGAWQNCCAVGVTSASVWAQLGSAWALLVEELRARA